MGIDYTYKAYVLREHSDLLIKAKRSTLIDYFEEQYYQNGVIPNFYGKFSNALNSQQLFENCKDNNLLKELKECRKINHASHYRTKRLKERIASMLTNGACVFLTLTFNDSCLASTTFKERRVHVSRYLKTFGVKYVANVDYGSKNHREHYHAIINTDSVDFRPWRKYGNINAEKIRNKDIQSDKTKLAKYICKLSNHAIKETTQRSALIYSR